MNEETVPAPGAPVDGDGSTAAATNSEGSSATPTGQGQGEVAKGGEGGEGEGGGPGEKPAGGETKPDDKPQGAPETYEAFTLPEGFKLEGERLEQAQAFAKANNWSQEQAQQGVDTYIALRDQERAWERGEFAERSREEYGDNFDEVVAASKRVREALVKERPSLPAELEELAQGNHPLTMFLFKKIADLTRERPNEGSGNEASRTRDNDPDARANRLYDKS